MKRKTIVGLALGAILAVTLTAMAAPTAQQSERLEAVRAKMVAVQKEMINAQANVGRITREQADRMIEQLDTRVARNKPLTEEQQQELATVYAKQVEVRKEMVNAEVEAGLISREQGDNMLKQIEAQAAYQEKIGFDRLPGRFGRNCRCAVQDDSRRGRAMGGMMMGGPPKRHDGPLGSMIMSRLLRCL